MPKKDCGECTRREIFEGLEGLRNQVPEPLHPGFGSHSGYASGLLSGIICHIDGVKKELETLEKDAMQDGSLFEKEGE